MSHFSPLLCVKVANLTLFAYAAHASRRMRLQEFGPIVLRFAELDACATLGFVLESHR